MHAAGEPVQDLLAKLQGQAKERMLKAYAPKSKGTLASAIRKFARFAQHVESRKLFQMSAVTGDRGAAIHNEWTLVLFVEWLLKAISEKTGKPVKVSTIETYVSLLKGYFIFTYDFEMPISTPRLTRMIALIKSDDPLGGQRSKRHGFRRRHLKALWKKGGPLCGAGADACARLAALGTAWHCFATRRRAMHVGRIRRSNESRLAIQNAQRWDTVRHHASAPAQEERRSGVR